MAAYEGMGDLEKALEYAREGYAATGDENLRRAIERLEQALKELSEPAPTPVPTSEPTAEPTPEPTEEPTPEPTEEPTPEPTPNPYENLGVIEEGDAVAYSGECNGVSWQITSAGKLIVKGTVEDPSQNFVGWNAYGLRPAIRTAYIEVVGAGNLNGLFVGYPSGPASNDPYRYSGMTKVDISGLDISQVTDLGSMFGNDQYLSNINFGDFDTGNVTNMGGMFSGCGSLQSLDLSGWDTGNVKDMRGMFNDCTSLTEIIVGSGWTGPESFSISDGHTVTVTRK